MTFAAITNTFNSAIKKKEIEEILLKAELTSLKSGISVFETLGMYANELYESETYIAVELQKIKKALESGITTRVAYAKYVSKTFLLLIVLAEDKGARIGDILAQFAPVYALTKRYQKIISNGLTFPIILFTVISIFFANVVKQFMTVKAPGLTLSPLSIFVAENYLYINFAFLAIFAVIFFKFKEKIPFLKKVYQKLESILAIALIDALLKMGLSTPQIVPIICNQFGVGEGKNLIGADANILIKDLKNSKYLTAFQAADTKIAIRAGDIRKAFELIKEEKLFEAELLGGVIGDAIKNIALLILLLPILLFMGVYGDLAFKILSLSMR